MLDRSKDTIAFHWGVPCNYFVVQLPWLPWPFSEDWLLGGAGRGTLDVRDVGRLEHGGRWDVRDVGTSGTLGRQDEDVGTSGTSGTLGREDVRTRMRRRGRLKRQGRCVMRGTGTLGRKVWTTHIKAGRLDEGIIRNCRLEVQGEWENAEKGEVRLYQLLSPTNYSCVGFVEVWMP